MTDDSKTPVGWTDRPTPTSEERQRQLVARGIALWNRTEERWFAHGTVEPEAIPARPLN